MNKMVENEHSRCTEKRRHDIEPHNFFCSNRQFREDPTEQREERIAGGMRDAERARDRRKLAAVNERDRRREGFEIDEKCEEGGKKGVACRACNKNSHSM